MDCPNHEPSSCMVLPIDRFTFTHPDGSQSVYIFATPEREAAGELLEALRSILPALRFAYCNFEGMATKGNLARIRDAEAAIAKAQRRPS